MYWIKMPKVISKKNARDNCPFHLCYKDSGEGACGWRLCLGRVCFVDY